MARNTTASVCLCLALLAGCSDDEIVPDAAIEHDAAVMPVDAAPPPDAPPPPDAAPPDARACAARVPPQVGAPCTTDPQCGPGGACLRAPQGWPAAGYCARNCTSDLQCGGGTCSPPLGGPGGARMCFAPCCGDGACDQADHACTDTLFGFLPLGGDACLPATVDAADGAACAQFYDCAPSSMCLVNPFDNPGGYCLSIGCTVGDDSTCAPGGDGHCIDFDPADMFPPACIDRCAITADCREGDGYECVDLGVPIGKVCLYPHRDPGEACGADAECGGSPWRCLTGASFPGGYCGADGCDPTDENTCPNDAVCYDADPGTLDGTEYCAARCDPMAVPAECRTGDGYACTDLSGGDFGCIVP